MNSVFRIVVLPVRFEAVIPGFSDISSCSIAWEHLSSGPVPTSENHLGIRSIMSLGVFWNVNLEICAIKKIPFYSVEINSVLSGIVGL